MGEELTSQGDHNSFILTPELIKTVVNPIVARIIKKDLRLHLDTRRPESSAPEAEDVYQTVLMRLHVQITHDLNKGRSINNFAALVAVIAHNVCNDTIRERWSEWKRTKDSLRHMFKSHRDFSLWQSHSSNRTLCGFKIWINHPENRVAQSLTNFSLFAENLDKIKAEKFNNTHPKNLPRPILIKQILLWIGSPVYLDDLVDFVFHLTEIKEIVEESFDPETISEKAGFTSDIANILDRNEQLKELWRVGQFLPLDQLRIFFLTEEDENGSSLLQEIVKYVAGPVEVCAALHITEEQLIELWPELALDPAVAALRFNQNHNVIKQWRSRARKKIGELIGIKKKKCA